MTSSANGSGQPARDAVLAGIDVDGQDIRFAVVLNGGVSLAVWISGVTLELHHLALASRGRGDWATYRAVLDLVNATARIDVIAGTSAGGLNGAFLALGLARDRDLATLRDLWRDNGAFSALLRHPLQKDPPSLLRGDDYFLTQVRAALQEVAAGPAVVEVAAPAAAAGASASPALDLFLTGTLWDGRTSVFTDDMGTAIAERDHDATFRFFLDAPRDLVTTPPPACGNLATAGVIDELARAARCTSSFPAAFEPHYVTVEPGDGGADHRTPSSAGRANFAEPQYVVDGGVLLNKPIRPALQAIYEKPAELQVRRVMAYVVPDPGEPPVAPSIQAGQDRAAPPLPGARDVLLAVLTRLRSTDSVSRELAEIRSRNADVASRRRARGRLAAALTAESRGLAERAWPGYRKVRADHAARSIGRLLAAGQEGRADRWSEQELADAVARLPLTFIPAETEGGVDAAVQRSEGDWDWGQTTVQRLGDITLDVLRRALWLAPRSPGGVLDDRWDPEAGALSVLAQDPRTQIVAARARVHTTLAAIRANRATLEAYWLAVPNGHPRLGIGPMPGRGRGVNESADNLGALQDWLRHAVDGWDRLPDPAADPALASRPRRAELYAQAVDLAGCLLDCAEAIDLVAEAGDPVVDPRDDERDQLRAFDEYLFSADGDAPDAAEVLRRMLRLDVVQLAFAGASQEVEQGVELVQVSSSRPDLLTGVQMHHFGAFYRAPWRVNDWLQGRMDGARQLITVLLSPERLRQVGWTGPDRLDQLLAEVHRIAVPDGHPDRTWLERQWSGDGRVEGASAACRTELAGLLDGGPPTTALGRCAEAIAKPVQLGILRDDLASLADAIRAEGRDTLPASATWLDRYDATDVTSAAGLWEMWERAEAIGRQRIPQDVGSDTFARTVSQAATVAAGTVGAAVQGRAGPSRSAKSLLRLASAFRGYTLMVWAMISFLTRPGNVGVHAVELALAAGGVLLAVTLLVPGIPVALTLLGVLLLLAGLTAAALRSRDSRPVARRLVVPLLVVAVGLGLLIWRDIVDHGFTGSTFWTAVVKFAVAVLIALLGLWIARAARQPSQPRRRPTPRAAPPSAPPTTTSPDRTVPDRTEPAGVG
jgi:patatin-related protein